MVKSLLCTLICFSTALYGNYTRAALLHKITAMSVANGDSKTRSISQAISTEFVALKKFQRSAAIKDSILNVLKQREIAELAKTYRVEKKDQEITGKQHVIRLLTAQGTSLESKLYQSGVGLKTIIVISVILMVLLAISMTRFRVKSFANQQLESMQKEIADKNDELQNLINDKDLLLEEKEWLIKEIHHRVKNNLQVVISLLNTQSSYLNDIDAADALRQSQHRMQSISLIHQKLYQSESRALINMKDYVLELFDYLRQSFDTGSRIQFLLDVDDLDLDVIKAVPLGLILNESITNSLKYAFPNEQRGEITLALNHTLDDRYLLLVSDNGIGFKPGITPDACQTLGINMIKDLCKEIDGSLELKNQDGVSVKIEFANKKDVKYAFYA